MKLELGRFARLSAGLAMGVAMAASSTVGSYAAADTSNGVSHFFTCLGELGNSAQHTADCGSSSNAPVPGGLSVPVHDGNFTCPSVGMVNLYRAETLASLETSPSELRDLGVHMVVAYPINLCCHSSEITTQGFDLTQLASLDTDLRDLGLPSDGQRSMLVATPCN